MLRAAVLQSSNTEENRASISVISPLIVVGLIDFITLELFSFSFLENAIFILHQQINILMRVRNFNFLLTKK